MTTLIDQLKIDDVNKRLSIADLILKIFELFKVDKFKKFIKIYFLEIITTRVAEKSLDVQLSLEKILSNIISQLKQD